MGPLFAAPEDPVPTEPLSWLRRLPFPVPPGVELAARSAFETGLLEAGRYSDRALAAFFRASAPAWPLGGAGHVAAIRREVAERTEEIEALGAFADPTLFHPPPPPANVRVVQHTFGIPGFTPAGVEEFEFWSEFRGTEDCTGGSRWSRRAENRKASGWMLAHRELDRPWLVCLHGYGMGMPAVDPAVFRAQHFHARLGLNVLGVTLPLHGRRMGDSRGARELIQTSPLEMLHAQAQAVWDVRRVLGWLRGLGAEGIAVHGFSLGGATASLLPALEADLECIITGCPAFDITENYRSAAADHPGGPVPHRHDSIWEAVRRLFEVVSPLHMQPVVARSQLAVYAGLVDQLVPSESTAALVNHWRSPKSLWYSGGHMGFAFDPAVQAFVDERLEATLLD